MYTEAFEWDKFPESLREANIVMLPKPGKESTDCKSYLLLSMINVNAEILEKILEYCLSKVVDRVIHADQLGFMGGRTTTTNIRKAFLIMKQAKNGMESCVVASLDAHKVFDTVN
ncbi:hypothetical protein NDU88_004980 [Pleurodeles waltl]|uniref:Reverse transcriptase domain-containing protein n=1 Tax=Pleurodeles waltl TaxID=8319 RepID=A0AAV7NMK4_PLEWA|nr:hypothetical protein NDU88_004980 [Pleurodeles waltl]